MKKYCATLKLTSNKNDVIIETTTIIQVRAESEEQVKKGLEK